MKYVIFGQTFTIFPHFKMTNHIVNTIDDHSQSKMVLLIILCWFPTKFGNDVSSLKGIHFRFNSYIHSTYNLRPKPNYIKILLEITSHSEK